ncbi:MAG TPA: alpha/beta fold hydrolase [Acidimicrobiales bacterium]|nr:alpha/beta fold hydrolase [Acidimicrobiales bacterium]
MGSGRTRRVLALLGTTAVIAVGALPALASIAAPPPPQVPVPGYGTGELKGIQSEFSQDDSGMPPGIANGPCSPSPSHPYPVVLVHGTFANENFSWQTLAPLLSDQGYCVFGLNYGATSSTTSFGNHTYGTDYVEKSAAELKTFIDGMALPDTVEPQGNAAGYPAGAHPSQVDMVGHSQGGMMPRYMIDTTSSRAYPGLGAAAQVHTLVALAPSNHGTDAYGLVPLFAGLFGSNAYAFPTSSGCPACGEQEAGSAFLGALNAAPDAAGVDFYVIESTFDELVTPYQSAFLPSTENVQNVTLQSQCPTDLTDHIGIIYDPVALQDVMNALGNNGPSATSLPQPSCPALVTPVVSG